MKRRDFITLLGGAAAWPLAARAQQAGKRYMVGILSAGGSSVQAALNAAFSDGLREWGWVEGKNVVFENRNAEDRLERLPELAADLIRLKVDVIVAAGTLAPLAAKQATATIPIVMTTAGDPLGSGLVASLARPGGNVTGLTWDADPGFTLKNVELLGELHALPQRIGGIIDPASPPNIGLETAQRGAMRPGLDLHAVEVRAPDQMEKAFASLQAARADAVLVFGGSSMLFGSRDKIAQLGLKNRLPVMFQYREGAESGGLLSYGPSIPDLWRRSAIYVE